MNGGCLTNDWTIFRFKMMLGPNGKHMQSANCAQPGIRGPKKLRILYSHLLPKSKGKGICLNWWDIEGWLTGKDVASKKNPSKAVMLKDECYLKVGVDV